MLSVFSAHADCFLRQVLSVASSKRLPPNYEATARTAEQLVLRYGQQMVWHSVHGAVFRLSPHVRMEVAQLLKLLLQHFRPQMADWLLACIEQLPKDSGLTATSEQLLGFKQRLLNCQRGTEINEELASLAKLYS